MGGSVSCRCEVDDRGAGFPRAPEAPKLGSLCGVFLISDGAGAGPLPSTRTHADGLNPGPLPSTRMASPTPSPSPSLIKTRNTKTPIFGASAGRGNPAPLPSSSHPQPTPGPAVGPFQGHGTPSPPPPSYSHSWRLFSASFRRSSPHLCGLPTGHRVHSPSEFKDRDLLFLDVEGEPVGAKAQKGLNRILGVFFANESAEGAGSCCAQTFDAPHSSAMRTGNRGWGK